MSKQMRKGYTTIYILLAVAVGLFVLSVGLFVVLA